jgi:hypothetical protein
MSELFTSKANLQSLIRDLNRVFSLAKLPSLVTEISWTIASGLVAPQTPVLADFEFKVTQIGVNLAKTQATG